MAKKRKIDLKRAHKSVTQELAGLNRDLATKMILLASQTGDTSPLVEAVKALRAADELYSNENTPRETAEVRQALADTLYTIGRTQKDRETLEHSVAAYRSAITIASLLGDETLRLALKKNYTKAKALYDELGPQTGKTRAA